ncbi:hypothetical protein OUZ56_032749 [Daphnia magna]|uniref:Uncharacterized protein n=1 Tax=Daphnia magna TaxID=35525 RepID=A0ABQ9ZXA8_9CRUS|nr:hypothetical protein OUZ56_032749 [Daphnia magna]
MKKNIDRYRRPDPVFHPGELVLIARRPKAKGKTKKRVSPTCFSVEDLPCNRKKRLWRHFNAHSRQIRRYFPRQETDWLPSDDDNEYEDATENGEDPRDSNINEET